MNFAKEIAKISLRIGAIKLDPQNPFLWASGYRMPVYNDNRLLLGKAEHRLRVAEGFRSILLKEGITVDVVAGTATAGIVPATTLANLLRTPLIYVRPTPKDHGMQNQIEGILQTGQNVVVVDDLISTGGSVLKSVEAIRQAGGQVDHCLSIFTYGFQKSLDQFRQARCHLHPLLSFETLIALARQEGVLDEKQYHLLQTWHDDPFTWAERQGFAPSN
ncbi:Orotate phosphoribosyltransferase [Candidatus Nitromaritima sp. SCGC AAA799-A02]|nr:Orotate phosphoribosyltransferase [Candidatus Nitromaritima sp. SCGC AAA799-A02]